MIVGCALSTVAATHAALGVEVGRVAQFVRMRHHGHRIKMWEIAVNSHTFKQKPASPVV